MTDVDEKRMTAEEWREAEYLKSEVEFMYQEGFRRERGEICPELDAALGDYMAALGDLGAQAAPLKRLDAGLVRLREVYREAGWPWEEYVKDPHLFRS
jgi:hypothetical protein